MEKYIDSAELISEFNIEYQANECMQEGLSDTHALAQFLERQSKYCIFNCEEFEPEVVTKCRNWLQGFVESTNHSAAGLRYREVWKAVLAIKDNYAFLQLMAANVPLMWD